MSELSLEGTLKVINDEEKITGTFSKRCFVIETNEQYPQEVQLELSNDKCSLIQNYKIGDRIKVHFNIRGRSWVSPKNDVKYFISLNAWRIESDVPPTSNTKDKDKKSTKVTTKVFQDTGHSDDLPF